ncbi:lysophospholipid acyltransferase family protein [Sporolactobacillus spathodeae]|uniref:1-acyl-sn-glycerol-3-phosphate acyltransferase n=1 Tax=Sporolactobacillus spathodeae TaxID=1465502 RepID=A0ABS2Q7P5_9BACL|nr:lysophospholipid acyltransferase family protein [Sporolactobacillus spathodeae]MBM7657816.1 1-acyl-sn-glycerol-3-phosphate acyltransferase [Sporolactobacillus spathodeae]
MSLYFIGKPLAGIFYRFYFRIEVKGQENLPDEGPVLICCNHRSNFDPPLIGISLKRQLSFVAKEELFQVPVLGSILRQVNAFPIKRGTGDRGAIRLALNLLRQGHALLIFPEGTRNHTGDLKKGLSGAGFFALNSNATVIPCAIIGNYKFRAKLTVVFGKPINTAALKEGRVKSSEASSVIMDQIRRLIEAN